MALFCNKLGILSRNSVCKQVCIIQSSLCLVKVRNMSFWEKDKRGGYPNTIDVDNIPKIKLIREGFKELKVQIGVWKEEVKEHLLSDSVLMYPPGETDILFNFDNPKELEKFTTGSDSDHGEGFSKCTLEMSKNNRALFSGTINTQVPKLGTLHQAGFCGMRSKRVCKSFYRESTYNWGAYNTLVLKVRGDGRSYMLNLTTEGYFDMSWNDMYQYVLYTRGGPYWQISKIPFSKFLFSSKGRVQDKQMKVPLHKIANFGIAVGDKINAPFSLEIEYIGLEYDPLHEEEFAYEMYQTDRFIAGS